MYVIFILLLLLYNVHVNHIRLFRHPFVDVQYCFFFFLFNKLHHIFILFLLFSVAKLLPHILYLYLQPRVVLYTIKSFLDDVCVAQYCMSVFMYMGVLVCIYKKVIIIHDKFFVGVLMELL
jgi:hypothetical protein